MDTRELFDNLGLLLDALLKALFELFELALLLVKVLDQSSTSFLHLGQPNLKTHPKGSRVPLTLLYLLSLNSILRVPDIVSNKLFNLNLPSRFKVRVIHILYLSHQSIDVFNQNVVSCNKHALLLLQAVGRCNSRIFRLER